MPQHITSQIGMFAYTGLSKEQCTMLTDKYHIYCTKNGRFSMAGAGMRTSAHPILPPPGEYHLLIVQESP